MENVTEINLKDGIFAGLNDKGQKVYIGKIKLESGDYVPSLVIPAENRTLYYENGIENSISSTKNYIKAYEYDWKTLPEDGKIPNDVDKSFLIGRAFIDGNLLVGKVDHEEIKMTAYHNRRMFVLKEFEYLTYGQKFSLPVRICIWTVVGIIFVGIVVLVSLSGTSFRITRRKK